MIEPLPPFLDLVRRRALIVAAAAGAVSLLAIVFSGVDRFLLGYLLAFVLFTGLTLGCLGVLMLQHVTDGAWGLVIRRPLESAARLTWVMALLSVPLLFGVRRLYVWATDPAARSDFQDVYLRPGFWVVRTIVYFAIWAVLAYLLTAWSAAEDRTADPRLARRMSKLSAIGLVIYGLTVTLAVVDWVMSLSPEWISTIYGFIFIGGQGLAAFAAMALVLAAIYAHADPLRHLVRRTHFHEIGNLMLAFLMFWAYVAFSQFLLIWAGNIADETPFYVYRTRGGLQYVSVLLIGAGFFVPFLCLLFARLKRSVRGLTALAAFVLLTRFLDLFWIVIPTYAQGRHLPPTLPASFHYQYILPTLAVGGLWVALYLRNLAALPLLPPHDPRIPQLEAAHA